MGTLLKHLQKSLSNLRFATSSTLNNYLLRNKQKLLLKRTLDDTPYLSALCPQNFSSTKHIHLPHFDQFRVVAGSCNGLVCLDNTLDEFLLWNPSTAETRIITSSRLWGPPHMVYRKHSFSSGLGYDSNSEHFKLVRFISSFREDRYSLGRQEIELYDLNSNSWRYIDHPGFGHFVLRNPSVYVDGYNYWLAYYNATPYILSFNFANEKLCAHDLPNVGKPLNLKGSSSLDSLHFDFVEFNGAFGVIVFPKFGSDDKSFELWLRNGETWIKEYEFCVHGAERPLGFWNNGRLLFFEGVDRQLMVYDTKTGKTKKLDIYDHPGKMQLVPYVESDVSIKGLLGTTSN